MFLREREKGTTAFKSMMRYNFKYYEDEESAPNLSDKVEIIADRGYWGRDMLRYLPSMITFLATAAATVIVLMMMMAELLTAQLKKLKTLFCASFVF